MRHVLRDGAFLPQKSGGPEVASGVQSLKVMDKKLTALKKAIDRVSNVAPPLCLIDSACPYAKRFTGLWKARNRRTRVLVRRRDNPMISV